MAGRDTLKIIQPADEIAQAETRATRYRCDFVDLREVFGGRTQMRKPQNSRNTAYGR
jgi:hypothetical protein